MHMCIYTYTRKIAVKNYKGHESSPLYKTVAGETSPGHLREACGTQERGAGMLTSQPLGHGPVVFAAPGGS